MRFLYLFLLPLLFSACVGEDILDDYVAPQIRLQNPVASIEEGTSYQFIAEFFNNVGQAEAVTPTWTSADPDILSFGTDGLANALAPGTTTITVAYQDEFGETASTSSNVEVGPSTVIVDEPTKRTGTARTTSTYVLRGDFELTQLPTGELKLAYGDDYTADTRLPGLYIYLTNNPNSNAGALELARVRVFSGAHEYIIPGVGLNDYSHVLYYCKPFSVKVGDGPIE
ncbi:Ig-like domain-containing protein [Neolewinella lacunae]|uniref:Ig-like domain-containing protein n=1 Tax=Neolewinella lacunae TaxID=1517758 RepID=A0A923PKD6_9BACT|nr:Ig-like domain-containing protein [Neolewinella lacunae]MBC6994296.1 Ig-like domain-containing protein [Neolewinella lacunae]MDN3634947.1 Ig-like domain-containing protein [Neolewinella lacunae]